MKQKTIDELYLLDISPTIEEYNQSALYFLDVNSTNKINDVSPTKKIEQMELF